MVLKHPQTVLKQDYISLPFFPTDISFCVHIFYVQIGSHILFSIGYYQCACS